jgi:hypothetical protein
VALTEGRDDPADIIEAWRLEGPEPVDLGRYCFED